ncbi:MAG: 1-deoxy-D-xylulose-5-phosphate reductoisomerase [Bacteroidetes bacterium]|nr:MAG: 1-deoxy-D-xylulose-5-phosphate reductoisomerase [Bacteroidota bacterium]
MTPHLRRVTVLGASGSIGRQTLSLLAAYPHKYRLAGISVHRRTEALERCLVDFSPEWVAITDDQARSDFAARTRLSIPILSKEALYERLTTDPGDIVVNGIVGAEGFWASYYTLQHPTARLALANKESLVFGGRWLAPFRERIMPVDSEHSALFQCLHGEALESVEALILTASGGPFRGKKRPELEGIAPEEALAHPIWKMGSRITVDSATLVNKALELIEAYWLFGLSVHRLRVWVHPECIVHSLVLFRDGSMKAQLSLPDMRLPILYALAYPEREAFPEGRSDLARIGRLHFEEVDEETFPSLGFARQALAQGGSAPALFNAADEVAVEAFLSGKIHFLDIFTWIAWALAQPEAALDPADPFELAAIEKEFRRKLACNLGLPTYAG